MDLPGREARIVGARWRARKATSAPGSEAPRRGTPRTSRALFRAYWPSAYRAAYLVVHDAAAAAADIAQEAFLAAVRNLDRFDRRRPFGPWLHRIVLNRAIDWSRRRQLRGEVELHDAPVEDAGSDVGSEAVAAMRRLSPEHRAVIVLRHLLGYTPGQIARLLELPPRHGQLTAAARARRAEGAFVKLDLPIPPGAEERAHEVAMGAFATHRPTPRRRTYWRPAMAVAVVAAVAGVLASPPGRSVIHAIREAVGVKKAQHELFSLPAPGRLLVNSSKGAWIVQQNGSKRLLGPYREASWSPFGRFVVAVSSTYELVAMEPNGKVHWTVPEPAVRLPSWGGTRTDTRIAYLSTPVWSVRSLAGDGTDGENMTSCSGVGLAPVRPAWRPGSLTTLALAARREVDVVDTTTCKTILRRRQPVSKLQWSNDGKLLLAFSPGEWHVYDPRGRAVASGGRSVDATFVGDTHRVAALKGSGDLLLDGKALFHSPGLRQIVSSPDGSWLLLTWPAANQWVFVRVRAPHTIRAYSEIERQLGGRSFPVVSGWIGQ